MVKVTIFGYENDTIEVEGNDLDCEYTGESYIELSTGDVLHVMFSKADQRWEITHAQNGSGAVVIKPDKADDDVATIEADEITWLKRHDSWPPDS